MPLDILLDWGVVEKNQLTSNRPHSLNIMDTIHIKKIVNITDLTFGSVMSYGRLSAKLGYSSN